MTIKVSDKELSATIIAKLDEVLDLDNATEHEKMQFASCALVAGGLFATQYGINSVDAGGITVTVNRTTKKQTH